MKPLQGKKILLAVSGGIAAYKMNNLVREFIKQGAEVQVILTPSSKNFVTPLTLSTLSKKPVYSDFYGENGQWNSHVELGLWADVILVAPCTANTLSKMVNGICDNLVVATYLSAKCSVFIAPAMDLDMYAHPSTKANIEKAEGFGHRIIPAQYGELASGLVGMGRMAEPETLVSAVEEFFIHQNGEQAFLNKKILITAGPTYEAIDPVRFIGNHSSGKMGYALAEEAARRGAEVILISGVSAEKVSYPSIQLIKITSAKEMYDEVFKYYDKVDIAIASAAVADYTPKEVSPEKIKKNDDRLSIELIKTPDILKTMGEKKEQQFLVGFALETHNEEEHAIAKLQKKNLDMIVLNSLKDKGAGFKGDTNKIQILTPNEKKSFDLKTKQEVARDILDFIQLKIQ